MKLYTLLTICLSLISSQALAISHDIDYKKSSISFTGEHAGNQFEGTFNDWNAEIDFNIDDLENSSLNATFETGSAETGNILYDGTLPQADWFAAKKYPEATFVSKQIIANGDGTYQTDGVLTIRSISKPVNFNFSLDEMANGMLNATGTLKVDRLLFDIGKDSDPDSQWVSRYIDITLNIMANRL